MGRVHHGECRIGCQDLGWAVVIWANLEKPGPKKQEEEIMRIRAFGALSRVAGATAVVLTLADDVSARIISTSIVNSAALCGPDICSVSNVGKKSVHVNSVTILDVPG